jgi:hypothetical protein
VTREEVLTQGFAGWKQWYLDDKLHRKYGPTIERPDGTGKRHLASTDIVTGSNGERKWYRDGKLHRENGPAAEWPDGEKWWYRGGQLHRDDGPAVERADGNSEWYLDGKKVTQDDVLRRGPSA